MKAFVSVVLAVLLLVALNTVVFAASKVVVYGGNYTELLGSGNCANKTVSVYCINNNTLQHNDVRMLDSLGNVVWEEYGAIDYSGSRSFWCGSNVYSIQIRVAGKNIIGDLMPKFATCDVIC